MTARAAFPARCAVALVCGHHLLSQVYPASVPVESFIDDITELVNDDLKTRGEPVLDPGLAYELQRANGARLDIAKTLDELGVEDGATLVLAAADPGDSFEPQYEALSTGLARVGKELFAPVTSRVAEQTAMAILACVTVVVLGLSARARLMTESALPAVICGMYGMVLCALGAWVRRWWPERHDLVTGLGCLAVPAVAVGAAAAAPGALAAPHLFIGVLTCLVLTTVLTAVSRRCLMGAAAVATCCVLGAALSAARMWRAVPAQWLAMGTLVALLILLTAAPTIALWAARIRPPHFGSITGRDLFTRRDGMPADVVAPVDNAAADEESPIGSTDEEADRDTSPTGAAIAESAKRANAVLTGLCLAAAAALGPAVWVTLQPYRPRATAAAVLSGLFVLIFISRARAFAARRQAVPLVLGAAVAVCGGVTRYALIWPPPAAALWGALLLSAFAAAGFAAALLVPATSFTPLVRMVTEWLELLAIVAALPLAAWAGGLFAWVRMR